jgi:pilus assembly protein CpaF
MSFDVILPFLRPIAHLIQDPDISEIMVNGSGLIFVERDGQLEEVTDVRLDERNLIVAVKNIARVLGDDVSEAQPILDSRLPDGSRVAAILPPCSVGGTTLTIRKFQTRFFTAEELVRIGTIPEEVLDQVRTAISQNRNILISGGTSTGKTTLLNALAAFLPKGTRVVLIEDTAELQLRQRNLVSLEARRAQVDLPAVTIRDLLRATLRLRPDRILVGEVRGGEAFDLLQALNTGHAGSLSTIHANSAEQALRRLATCVAESAVELPYQAVRYQIAEAVHLVLHLGRRDGKRVVEELLKVGRFDATRDRYDSVVLFDHARARSDAPPVLAGDHHARLECAPPSASGGVDVAAAV